jgi:hypothetical protein
MGAYGLWQKIRFSTSHNMFTFCSSNTPADTCSAGANRLLMGDGLAQPMRTNLATEGTPLLSKINSM